MNKRRRRHGQGVGIAIVVLALVVAALPVSPAAVSAGELQHEATKAQQSRASLRMSRWPMSFMTGLEFEPIVEQLPPRSPEASADLVVIISADGLRPDAITRETHNLWKLFATGVAPHYARTIDKSSTLPSHASMVSGYGPVEHGLRFNAFRPKRGRIHVPTVFSLAGEANLPTWMFVGKKKLKHVLADPNEVHFEMSGIFCQRVVREALPTLQTATKGVVFVHFADPDSAGHRHGWMTEDYHATVRRTDRCIGKVLDTLEEAGRMDRTLVLVTSDHGGHGRSHGTRLRADQRIPWMAYGAGANARRRVQREVNTMDTAATVLAALGITPPEGMQGRPVLEALGAIEGPVGMPFVGAPFE